MELDPIKKFEDFARNMHDHVGRHTEPVLKRYPLVFAFLLTFSAAAIIHGFELFVDQFEIFNSYPSLLISIGIIALAITGTLYKVLQKID